MYVPFHLYYIACMAQEIVRCRVTVFCGCCRPIAYFYRLSAVSPKVIGWFPLFHTFRSPLTFAMSTPPALPAPGGNASAALTLTNVTQPEEVVIHSGAATTEGDMSYLDEEFDPCRQDPRRNMCFGFKH